ncbi:MAG: hypothetical protein H6965_06940 [Chromatiaceae bacterium]|nr:hypothetical protein [Chromatiaceae bacterium]
MFDHTLSSRRPGTVRHVHALLSSMKVTRQQLVSNWQAGGHIHRRYFAGESEAATEIPRRV